MNNPKCGMSTSNSSNNQSQVRNPHLMSKILTIFFYKQKKLIV